MPMNSSAEQHQSLKSISTTLDNQRSANMYYVLAVLGLFVTLGWVINKGYYPAALTGVTSALFALGGVYCQLSILTDPIVAQAKADKAIMFKA